MNFEDIYLKSPVLFQQLLINIQGLKIQRTRYNENFKKYLSEYQVSDSHIVDVPRFSNFLTEALKTSFWNDRFKKYQLSSESSDPVQEIRKLPILTKKEVKENISNIINISGSEKYAYAHTSGTTGSGLIFPQTLDMENRQWAVWWRYRYIHGITTNTWMGWFGGRSIADCDQKKPPYWRINFPMKQVMFSVHHLNEATVHLYFEQIKKRRLTWLHGYPSQISLLAHLIRKRNLGSLPDIKIITVGAENLLQSQRSIIEDVFSSPVKQHYGLAEGVANISEQADGSLFADQDFAFVEFIPVDDENPALCRIIGTNYNNIAFPLIRYDTGDLAQIEWQEGVPKIISINGRQEDYITLPNGVKLGRLDHIFKDLTEVQEAQIFQPDIHHIKLRIVKGSHYDESNQQELVIKETKKRLGNEIKVEIEYLDRITRTNSGKLKFVISNVK